MQQKTVPHYMIAIPQPQRGKKLAMMNPYKRLVNFYVL